MDNKRYNVDIELFGPPRLQARNVIPASDSIQLIDRKPDLRFYDVLKSSYNDQPNPNQFKDQGFILDQELSTRNNQVYVNPKRKKLLFVTAGTRLKEGSDVYHDAMSVLGVKTSRYTDAKNILEKARKKHDIKRAHLVGHSLGFMVSNAIAEPQDEVLGYNGAIGLPTGHKSKTKRVYHIKDDSDLITIAKADKIIKGVDPSRLGNKEGGHGLKYLFNTSIGNTDVFKVHNEL